MLFRGAAIEKESPKVGRGHLLKIIQYWLFGEWQRPLGSCASGVPGPSGLKCRTLPMSPASKFDVRARMLGIHRVTRVANQRNALTMQQASLEEVILDHVLLLNKDLSDTQNKSTHRIIIIK